MTLEDMIFDNSGSSLAAFSVDTPADAKGLRTRRVILICGTGDGFSGPPSTALLHDSDIEADVRNIANGKRGVTFNGIVDSRFKVKTAPAAGATTAIGFREQAIGARNIIEDSDFSLMTGGNTGVELAQAASTYRNIKGFITRARGTAVVASGSTSIVVAHGLARTPSVLIIDPTNNKGSWWRNAVSATNFTINVGVDPGVATATFAWEAIAENAT